MEDVFVIGHGRSLLNLSEEEKEYIRSRPSFTTSIYLLFYEVLNIVPDYLVLPSPIDDYPARHITPGGSVLGSATVCEKHKLKTHWYVHEQLYEYLINKKLTKSFWQKACPRVGGKPVHPRIKLPDFNPSFKINQINCGESPGFHKVWATNLEEKFLFSSSSATAINLACILYPNHNIKLVGVDGGTCTQFYHTASEDGFRATLFTNELTHHGTKRSSGSIHYSTQHLNISLILRSSLDHHGCNVFNCNKNSVFIEGNDDHEFQARFLKLRNKNNRSKFKYKPVLP
jgi:hypothetical protein